MYIFMRISHRLSYIMLSLSSFNSTPAVWFASCAYDRAYQICKCSLQTRCQHLAPSARHPKPYRCHLTSELFLFSQQGCRLWERDRSFIVFYSIDNRGHSGAEEIVSSPHRPTSHLLNSLFMVVVVKTRRRGVGAPVTDSAHSEGKRGPVVGNRKSNVKHKKVIIGLWACNFNWPIKHLPNI